MRLSIRRSVYVLTVSFAAVLCCFEPGASWADAAKVGFEIAHQRLATALREFARVTRQEILFSSDAVADKTSAGVVGDLTPEEALNRLLAGTGLVVVRAADGVILVTTPDAKEASQVPDPTRAPDGASAASGSTKTSPASGHEVGKVAPPGVLAGEVRAEGAGSGLPGALVKLVSTGQWTSTDRDGRFRLLAVPPGAHTIVVSYLGYEDSTTTIVLDTDRPGISDIHIMLSYQHGANLETIVVYGRRSSRALALNQQRTAENTSTVVSADQLGNFPGTTVADALRRSAAIAFQQDPLTGDGTNIIVRGLAPDMNQVKLNGVVLPEGSGTGRAPSLNNILADSIDKITISKTLLANQDSSGTGGLVEIETKSPLNRPHRYVGFGIEAGERAGDFSKDYLATGTLSGTFGRTRDLGASLSVQYRDRTINSIAYSSSLSYGQYLPLEADGSTAITGMDSVDPRKLFPFEPGAAGAYPVSVDTSRNETRSRDLSITATGAWHLNEHTDLRLDYVRADANNESFRRNVSWNSRSSYVEQPVVALDGQVRQALSWDGTVFLRHDYSLDKSRNQTDTVSFRGTTARNQWNAQYHVGYARGALSAPGQLSFGALYGTGSTAFGASLDPSLLLPGATDPVEARVLSPFGPRNGRSVPLPLLTTQGWARINDSSGYFFSGSGVRASNGGENRRLSADSSVHRDFQRHHLRYVEAGLGFESSTFSTHVEGASVRVLPEACAPGDFLCQIYPVYPSLADFGLQLTQADLATIGLRGQGFSALSRADFNAFWRDIDSNSKVAITPFDFDPRQNQQSTTERNTTAYLQARFDFGRLETIAGVRLDRVGVVARNLIHPSIVDANGDARPDIERQLAILRDQQATQTVLLPRLQSNFRLSDKIVIRGAYYQSVARPTIEQLSTDVQLSLDLSPFAGGGPNFDQPLLIYGQGNPGLKPAITHSFDLSIERYFENVGAISLGAFYKQIDNELTDEYTDESSKIRDLDLPDNPIFQNLPTNLVVQASKPVNSTKSASIWGLELSGEYQFTGLPKAWDGLGAFSNVTYTHSSRTQQYFWFYSPVFDADGALTGRELRRFEFTHTPFSQQPPRSGTVALTYNKFGVDGSLAYTFQDRRRRSFEPHGLTNFDEAVSTLDLHAEYHVERGSRQYRVYLEFADILHGPHDPSVESTQGGEGGVAKFYLGGNYLGGRSVRVGLTAHF